MGNSIIKVNIKPLLMVGLLLFISGCSAQFTYNNLGWLSSFWIDDYVDLTKQQNTQFKAIVKKSRDWHRETQLPLYKQDLLILQKLLQENPQQLQLETQLLAAKQHWQSLVQQIKDDIAELALSLTEAQRRELVDNIAEKIANDVDEYNELGHGKHLQQRLEKQLDKYQQWLGPLTPEQVAMISVENEQRLATFQLWQDYKRNRLAALERLFSNKQMSQAEFKAELNTVMTERELYMSDALIAADSKNLSSYVQLLIALRESLTAEQLNHANQEFADLIEQIDELIAD
ncbi:DUF6279 family lipoprotein [Pseudoalteromonas mariniglutinosa]|uniref:DUF6279 family lipoprotein n=2 Tax=Pseudoalteromonas mariniglutinosa TaxID=206042 RepID=UPI00384B5D85